MTSKLKCTYCQKTIYKKTADINKSKTGRFFCSKSCSAKHNNKGNRRHGQAPSKCLSCGNKTNSHKAKYCSHKCKYVYEREQYISAWLCGKESGGFGPHLSSRVRTYLLDESEYSCSECGWNKIHEGTGKCPLNIHHKDGDPFNHSKDNLVVLCPNCHALTESYGALNKGSGRGSSRKRTPNASGEI